MLTNAALQRTEYSNIAVLRYTRVDSRNMLLFGPRFIRKVDKSDLFLRNKIVKQGYRSLSIFQAWFPNSIKPKFYISYIPPPLFLITSISARRQHLSQTFLSSSVWLTFKNKKQGELVSIAANSDTYRHSSQYALSTSDRYYISTFKMKGFFSCFKENSCSIHIHKLLVLHVLIDSPSRKILF